MTGRQFYHSARRRDNRHVGRCVRPFRAAGILARVLGATLYLAPDRRRYSEKSIGYLA